MKIAGKEARGYCEKLPLHSKAIDLLPASYITKNALHDRQCAIRRPILALHIPPCTDIPQFSNPLPPEKH
jgi:hypothetical protein